MIIKEINESGIFKNNSEKIEYLILKYINESLTPVGSWILTDYLCQNGINTSLSTVGRILKKLDRKMFTYMSEGRGRLITEKGKEHLLEKNLQIKKQVLNEKLLDSVQVNSVKELKDLFTVRIILESEVVKISTELATDKDFETLRQNIVETEKNLLIVSKVTDLNSKFHKEIFRITTNKFLISIEEVIMQEQWSIETTNCEVRAHYKNKENLQSHKEILEAMIMRDGETAASIMKQHLELLRDDAISSI